MPPRTRATTSTAPAGRRPKVAGLRSPGRSEVTESGETSASSVGEGDDPGALHVDGTTGEAAASDRPDDSPSGPDETAEEGGGSRTASAAAERAGAQGQASPSKASPSKAPSSKAPSSKAGRGKQPTGAAAGGRTESGRVESGGATGGARAGTALLDRPERPQTGRPASKGEPERPSRRSRIAAAITRPFAAAANPRRLTIVLAVALVVCLALAALAFFAARSDRAEGAPYANQAVVDVGGTAEVVGQTRQALEQILSYDFTKLDDSVNAAKSQSVSPFSSQYLQVFEQTIRGPAQEQKLRQTASVLNIGVQQLSGDRASVMVLVQFTAQRTTNQQTTNAPGLLKAEMVRQDGRWKLSELKPM